jgi:hypothetical protein
MPQASKKSKSKELSVFERHAINIARQTLKMPDAILGVMGGMTKEQARAYLQHHGLQEEEKEKGQQNTD